MSNEQSSAFDGFGFYRYSDLTEADKTPPEFIVEGMIPVGLTFLAGAPKIRKSFFALGMAAAVARGEDFMGFRTTPCDVCYLDLEGSKFRIAERSKRMPQALPDNLFFANSIRERLSSGLVGKLRQLHQERPAIRLVIIDTYSHARGTPRIYGNTNAYDADVQLLEPLQRMAIDAKIAVVCIHHNKKGGTDVTDPFERLSGTMGISGSSDCVITLTADGARFSGRAKLEYVPRDARGGEMMLFFDDSTLQWGVDPASKKSIWSDHIARWCIENKPREGENSAFCSYSSVFQGAYGTIIDNPGLEVRQSLEAFKGPLFQEYGVAVQIGARSHGARGIRLMRV